MEKILFLSLPETNRVSCLVYNPIIVRDLSIAISEFKEILAFALLIKLFLNRMVSPSEAESISALKLPIPLSFVLETTKVEA